MNEITENLVSNEDNKKPKRNKKRVLIILFVIVILVIAVFIGYKVYDYLYEHSDENFIKNLDIAQKYLDDHDYENAILSFDYALEITNKSENKILAYTGLSKAAALSNNINKAQEAYTNLFELTGDPLFQEQINLVNYGNSSSNISNRGLSAQRANQNYYLKQNSNDSSIWKIDSEEVSKLTTLPFDTEDDIDEPPVKNLSAWGDKVYLIYKGNIIEVNIYTGEFINIIDDKKVLELVNTLENEEIDYFEIYDNTIYFIVKSLDDDSLNYLCTYDLENNNSSIIKSSIPEEDLIIDRFILNNDNIYLTYQDENKTTPKVSQFNIDTPENEKDIYTGTDDSYILTQTIVEDKIYFTQLVDDSDELKYDNNIYYIDTQTQKSDILMSPGSVSTINTDGSHLYYVSDNVFYKSNFDSGGIVDIGEAPSYKGENEDLRARHIINISEDDIYVTTSTSLDEYVTYGVNSVTYETNTENLDSFTNITETLDEDDDVERIIEISVEEPVQYYYYDDSEDNEYEEPYGIDWDDGNPYDYPPYSNDDYSDFTYHDNPNNPGVGP